jgi:hypothetical protein
MEMSGQLHGPAALPPGKEPPVTHWIGGCMGLRFGMDAVVSKKEIRSPRRESKPDHPIVHPIASRYTDWGNPAHSCNTENIEMFVSFR